MLQQIYDKTMEMKKEEHRLWKLCYRIEKLLVGIGYPLWLKGRRESGIAGEKGEMIVSLTSYPARIGKVWITVASLMEQTILPARIILWLSKEQFPNEWGDIPANLLKMVDRGLEIRFCEDDLRSHKKYFYAIQEFPESYIVTADDDIIYPPEHLERLWNKHLEYPNCICCHYGHVITFDREGIINSYDKWQGGTDGFEIPALRLMPVGCNGVLYPPHSISMQAFDAEMIKQCCLSADDIWLKAMGILQGTKAVTCNTGALVYYGVLNTSRYALYKENANESRNDDAIRKIIEKYPQINQILYQTYQDCMEEWQPRILVAHPGKQHSLRTAYALQKKGMLAAYLTTMYDKPHSMTHALTCLLTGQNQKKAQSRKIQGIPDNKVILRCEMTGLLGRLFARVIHSPQFYNQWNDYMNRCFGRKVAKYVLRHHIDAVISYDNDSELLFSILSQKVPGIPRILDVSIANRLYLKTVYENDMRQMGDDGLKKEQENLWDDETIKRLQHELELSQYFLAPSETVKNSLVYSRVDTAYIHKVPYGVDAECFRYELKQDVHMPLRLIFVGNVSYRKGCHHLLKAVAELGSGIVQLRLAGSYDAELYRKYKDVPNIEFLGFVTHDVLADKYRESDVFILPSLGEGMAMVGIEALSCGLPVICTEMTGINDVIVDGENGFVIRAGSEEDIKQKIEWFIQHQNIAAMSENARKTAEIFTWEHYYDNVVIAIRDILKESGK